jgi:3-deoxy-D-manno-octulosonic-acid transferase
MIAPRHPDRGRGIVEIANAAGLKAVLRSQGRLPQSGDDIYIVDTLGELGLVYRLAPIVFVGGSLSNQGGHNPIEAVKLGAAILHGPYVGKTAEIYEMLDGARGAEQVTDVGKLAVRMGALLKDAEQRKTMVAAAREALQGLGGALDRTLAALDPYLVDARRERRDDHA